MVQEPGRVVDLAGANRFGQQLFFANLHGRRPSDPRRPGLSSTPTGPGGRSRPLPRLSKIGAGHTFDPVPWRQLLLFEIELDPAQRKAQAEGMDSDLLRYCDEIVRDHATRHGWSRKQTNDVRRSLRLVQVLQPTPGANIPATDVLRALDGNTNVSVESTLEVLSAAGLLIEDRLSPAQRYFAKKTAGLPSPMTAQLQAWYVIMLEGSTKTPRRLPRDPMTARLHIRAIAPILRVWASQGHDSLVEIDRDDVLAALPPSGPARHLAQQGLRSLFRVLKSKKMVFVNPTRGIPVTATNATIPLPLDTTAIQDAITSTNPATALAVALVAFHALRSQQIRDLKLTDIRDGRLSLNSRDMPLAGPVLPRLAAWLDYRARTWPATINPHLFVNRRTAPRLMAVSRPFPWRDVTFTAQSLREDRILDEVRATGGDVRRICELFDLNVGTALRYIAVLDHTDTRSEPSGSPTQGAS
jgi:hypothetical protein